MAYEQKKYNNRICYSFVDFALFLQEAGWTVSYEPKSIATLYLESSDDKVDNDIALFTSRWNSKLSANIEANFLVSDTHLTYRMECGTAGGNVLICYHQIC